MGKIGAPEPPPAGIAGFRVDFPLQPGRTNCNPASSHMPHPHTARVGASWPVAVNPTLGGSFKPAPQNAIPSTGYSPVPASLELAAAVDLPRFDFAGPAAPAMPAASSEWAPSPQPQAAERWIALSSGAIIPATLAFRRPLIGNLPVSGTYIRKVTMLVPSPEPEAVVREVHPIPDSRPAPSRRPLSMLRFSLHAVDEVAPQPAASMQVPPPAEVRPGLQPEPVESMPAMAALSPAALASRTRVTMPTIRGVVAQVFPQAPHVEGPAPVPVESMPAVAAFAPSAAPANPALRLPTLAHFQPAEDASELLAAPIPAAGPAPVESMPAAAAFTALPLPVAPAMAAQTFAPEIRARFDLPRVAGPAPSVVEPPVPQPQPAALDPIARIAAQPAGAQPERPTPAIPRPGVIPLEYYCQRIASSPVKRIEPIAPRVALVQQPFVMAPALGSLDSLLKRKPHRIVLPFEGIFAKPQPQDAPRKRLAINTWGKIAAAVMVGIALWTGSRVANLSRHTQELKAEVAASERTVAVAESRSSDPTVGNFGNGPVGRVRRAIANRAATEITDTFRAGMAAWGAQQQSWAPGWKHHPQGYVSTGEMALFQPSLKYTDYRMEFYGQIEDKSLGWVVRAQDKKNYYAMKFTVIEPGLRPIIAMVHYSVVNGRPGHKVQTPLSVMVHNHRPMHVALDVRGNHFTASIDGERIESWTDEAAAQGGVGFFSDPGEKARLYWMKLSRNQDMLGRVCAYLSGGRSRQQTASVEAPGNTPEPVSPRLPALALAAAGPWNRKHRRREVWSF